MADHPRGRGRQGGYDSGPSPREPEVRRWPHPVGNAEQPLPASARETDAALYYIHCALSYQNQLLADIKALLEQVSVELDQHTEGK